VSVYLSNGVVLTVNAVDLSTLVTSVTLNRTFDELEVTAMGDSGHKFVKGLEASSITIDFLNDEATSNVTSRHCNAVHGTNTTVTVVLLAGKGNRCICDKPSLHNDLPSQWNITDYQRLQLETYRNCRA
jgi:hypothetical protein